MSILELELCKCILEKSNIFVPTQNINLFNEWNFNSCVGFRVGINYSGSLILGSKIRYTYIIVKMLKIGQS